MRGHRISECLCFHQQSCSLDWWGDCGWGVRYKSAVLLWGWLLACYARIPTMSLLPCLRTEFSQRRLTSAVKGQPRDVFILITQLAWLVTKAPYHLHTHADAHTRRFMTLTSSASPFSAKPLPSHAFQAHRCTPLLTHNPSLPAANKNMKNEDSEIELPAMAQGEFG